MEWQTETWHIMTLWGFLLLHLFPWWSCRILYSFYLIICIKRMTPVVASQKLARILKYKLINWLIFNFFDTPGPAPSPYQPISARFCYWFVSAVAAPSSTAVPSNTAAWLLPTRSTTAEAAATQLVRAFASVSIFWSNCRIPISLFLHCPSEWSEKHLWLYCMLVRNLVHVIFTNWITMVD